MVAAGLALRAVCVLDAAAAAALGLSARDVRLVGALRPRGVSEEALKLGHCCEGVEGRGTGTWSGGGANDLKPAVGAEPLDPSDSPVYWKATIVEMGQYVALGVTGNAQPADQGYSDPTSFCWWGGANHIFIAGKNTSGHGDWAEGNIVAGDVCVFKLEAYHPSLRVQRLGAQTFAMPTNGAQNLRVFASLYQASNRVQLAQAEPGEEY